MTPSIPVVVAGALGRMGAEVIKAVVGATDCTLVGAVDNTPGKDVGNLRLSDSIGGSNAEVQEDGAPGYGGVFIESYLWWSSHPELSLERPAGAPPVDPLFDEILNGKRTILDIRL